MQPNPPSLSLAEASEKLWVSGRKLFRLFALTLALLMFGDIEQFSVTGSPTTSAAARIGRPLTPHSVAGVARRTARRHYYCHGRLYYHPCHY
jgi:hypothetical protein